MRTRHWLVLAAVATLAAMTGTAWATGTIASIAGPDGTINGCYKTDTDKAGQKGELRLVAADEECKNNELAIQWSQQGPEGPEGPEGPAGAGLVGSSCTIPGVGNGTVQMAVAGSGAISFTCVPVSGGGGGGSAEVCDGVDNDLDGQVDEGDPGGGGPGPTGGILHCVGGQLVEVGVGGDSDLDGYTPEQGDCDDSDSTVYPGAIEQPFDQRDNDCDGIIDEGGPGDSDLDGYTPEQGDCDDSDSTVFPGAPELPDGRDNDCDGTIDEGV